MCYLSQSVCVFIKEKSALSRCVVQKRIFEKDIKEDLGGMYSTSA
jgi:hypothetical protein